METSNTDLGTLTSAWLLEKAHLNRANKTELAAYKNRMEASHDAALKTLAEAVAAQKDPRKAIFVIINVVKNIKDQTKGEGVGILWEGLKINPQQLAGEVRDKVHQLDATLSLDEDWKKTA